MSIFDKIDQTVMTYAFMQFALLVFVMPVAHMVDIMKEYALSHGQARIKWTLFSEYGWSSPFTRDPISTYDSKERFIILAMFCSMGLGVVLYRFEKRAPGDTDDNYDELIWMTTICLIPAKFIEFIFRFSYNRRDYFHHLMQDEAHKLPEDPKKKKIIEEAGAAQELETEEVEDIDDEPPAAPPPPPGARSPNGVRNALEERLTDNYGPASQTLVNDFSLLEDDQLAELWERIEDPSLGADDVEAVVATFITAHDSDAEQEEQSTKKKKGKKGKKDKEPEERKDPGAYWFEIDIEDGDVYFFNVETEEAVWEPPPEFTALYGTNNWEKHKDESRDAFYFHNKVSGETTWAKPAELEAWEKKTHMPDGELEAMMAKQDGRAWTPVVDLKPESKYDEYHLSVFKTHVCFPPICRDLAWGFAWIFVLGMFAATVLYTGFQDLPAGKLKREGLPFFKTSIELGCMFCGSVFVYEPFLAVCFWWARKELHAARQINVEDLVKPEEPQVVTE